MDKQSSAAYHNHGVEFQVDIETLQEFSQLLQSQPNNLYSESWRRRQIQKVPPQIRRSKQVYDPVLVSIGPYHHGKPELQLAEEFKHLCLDRCAGGDEKKKAFFYSKILDKIEMVRDSYADSTTVEKYDDKSLALMMLLDASIIIDYIHNFLGRKGSSFLDWQRCLGTGSGPLMIRDMLLMENQIPFHVLTLYEEGEAALFIPRFITWLSGYKMGHASIPQDNEDPPLHFLEALWRVEMKRRKHTMIMSERGNMSGFSMREEIDTSISYTHRSVMDLKAKGIRVRPYSTIKVITFTPSVCFSQLHLPVQYVSDLTLVIWSNMIAFEVSPNSSSSPVMLSYAILMKSLIQSPEDVKELQERGVLINLLANLEKVVELLKEIDTFGIPDQDMFKDVRRSIAAAGLRHGLLS